MKRSHVIFLGSHNCCRSQIAEAFLRRYASDRFEAHSAGLEPSEIHPLTVRVMEEVGISLEGHRAKPLSEFLGKVAIQHAIIVCEWTEERCPRIWPFGASILSWPFDHPAASGDGEESRIEKFRVVRDEIEDRVNKWISELEAG